MRFAFFAVLALIAAGFFLALLIGVAVRIAVLVGLVALILVAGGYIMRRFGKWKRRNENLARDRYPDLIDYEARERVRD
jgi:hypothetical protein